MASQFWAVSAVTILERFAARYGRPSRQDMTEFFTSALIDDAMAERISLALELWWDDRPDESAHVLVPRLEAAVRNLAREIGLPIIREPYGGKPGGVRPLGELLHQLEGRFPTAGWHAYLLHLLVDPLGLNLRNVVAHGVRARMERSDAALLLHAAAFLRLLQVQRGADGENRTGVVGHGFLATWQVSAYLSFGVPRGRARDDMDDDDIQALHILPRAEAAIGLYA
jgi:hypothetical protein